MTAPQQKRRSGAAVFLIVLSFFAYSLWMIGPYLVSTVVRDAAVTSWAYTITSPIDGIVEFDDFSMEDDAEGEKVVLRIKNLYLSRASLIKAENQVEYQERMIQEWENFLSSIEEIERDRSVLKSEFAEAFRQQLVIQIESLATNFDITLKQLEAISKIADREEELARRGALARNSADEAALRVSDLELQLTNIATELEKDKFRLASAQSGVFLTEFGEDPSWVRGSRIELKIEKKNARLEMRRAEIALRTAKAQYEDTKAEFQRLSNVAISLPENGVIWSRHVARGAEVRSGDPLFTWIDCSFLKIDVPVSDATVALIKPGMEAQVILEGAKSVYSGQVIITRGSASTLARDDLAAVAKGRHEGVAQVLLDISHLSDEFETCPVGRGAYVDFPEIGLIEVIRARLRL